MIRAAMDTQAPGPTLDEVREMLERHPWTFAKTRPNNPHFWTTIKQWPDASEFTACVRFIREHGEDETWRDRKPYRVLHVGGWKYWSMGDPIDQTVLMNRCKSNRP